MSQYQGEHSPVSVLQSASSNHVDAAVSTLLTAVAQKERAAAAKLLLVSLQNEDRNADKKLARTIADLVSDSNAIVAQLAVQCFLVMLARGSVTTDLGKLLAMQLIDKLGASKDIAREAAAALIAALLKQPQPRAMLTALIAAPLSPNSRTRTEAIRIIDEDVLYADHLRPMCDMCSLVNSLARAAEDSKSRPAALDTLCRLHFMLGAKFQVLLNAAASVGVRQAIAERVEKQMRNKAPPGAETMKKQPVSIGKSAPSSWRRFKEEEAASKTVRMGRISSSIADSPKSGANGTANSSIAAEHLHRGADPDELSKSTELIQPGSDQAADSSRPQLTCSPSSTPFALPNMQNNSDPEVADQPGNQVRLLHTASAAPSEQYIRDITRTTASAVEEGSVGSEPEISILEAAARAADLTSASEGGCYASSSGRPPDPQGSDVCSCRPSSTDTGCRTIEDKLVLLKERLHRGKTILARRRVMSAHASLAVELPGEISAEQQDEESPAEDGHGNVKAPSSCALAEAAPLDLLQSSASLFKSSQPEHAPSGRASDLLETLSQPRRASAVRKGLAAIKTETAAEEMSEEALMPCLDPRQSLDAACKALATANAADRLSLDWQAQNAALMDVRTIAKFHKGELRGKVIDLCRLLAPALLALRSNTSKMSMTLIQELVATYGHGADGALETLLPGLAQRSGEVSNAGRETFLASVADITIACLIQNLSPLKVAAALLASCQHKSGQVKAKMASHLDALLQSDAATELPGNRLVMEQVVRTAAALLEEGSPDARAYGKRILWRCRQLADAQPEGFHGLLTKCAGEGAASKRRVLEAVQGDLPSLPARKASGDSRSSTPSCSPHGPSALSMSFPSSPLKDSPSYAVQSRIETNIGGFSATQNKQHIPRLMPYNPA